MCSQPGQADIALLQVQQVQQGDPEALATLRNQCQAGLVNILMARGASRTETEDLLADLWTDCVPGPDDRHSLLEKFSGRCSIQGWLATVATRRWIDLKRRQTRRVAVENDSDQSDTGFFERVPATLSPDREGTLIDLLRDSLKAAFALCPPEAKVMLHLVYLHQLTQRELVRLLGWSESKVSRALSQAMQQIETHTLSEVKKNDPMIELTWQDFLDLCETYQIGFL